MPNKTLVLSVMALLLAFAPGGARAGTPELSGSWGWMWGGSANSRSGKLRLDSAMDLQGVISVPVRPLYWAEFHYTWQGTEMTLDGQGPRRSLTDMNIHHMQIAGARALKDGPVGPYIVSGIGTTYFSPSASFVDIDGTRYTLDSSWKLSFLLGVGVKVWLGEAERVGLRLQFRTLPSLYNSSTGIWVGGGGGSISVSGSAVWQFDVSAGLAVKFGG
jgi:hypothetical protein